MSDLPSPCRGWAGGGVAVRVRVCRNECVEAGVPLPARFAEIPGECDEVVEIHVAVPVEIPDQPG